MMRRASLVLAATCALGCGGPRRPPPRIEVSQREWSLSRARLAAMRRAAPARPYVARVRLSLREPRSGKVLSARGALAVSPGQALRMVLLGPGGATALDAWVTRDRYRFAVPGVDLVARGRPGADEAGGFPVGFFRWWFLDPLPGRLLVGRATPRGAAWLLAEGGATVSVHVDGAKITAVRRAGADLEVVEYAGGGVTPRTGATATYVESRHGLAVHVVVEEVLDREPDAEAFTDPDAEGTPL